MAGTSDPWALWPDDLGDTWDRRGFGCLALVWRVAVGCVAIVLPRGQSGVGAPGRREGGAEPVSSAVRTRAQRVRVGQAGRAEIGRLGVTGLDVTGDAELGVPVAGRRFDGRSGSDHELVRPVRSGRTRARRERALSCRQFKWSRQGRPGGFAPPGEARQGRAVRGGQAAGGASEDDGLG